MRQELEVPDSVIAEVYGQGMTAKDIGVYLDIRTQSVTARLRKMGVTLRDRSTRALMVRDRIGHRREQHPRWKGGVSPRPDLNAGRWKEIRAEVLERDEFCCTECGGTKRLSVHHDEDGSLRTLCSPCHIRLHKPEEARWGRKDR